jgi:molybdopterin synthase catalytic subunit
MSVYIIIHAVVTVVATNYVGCRNKDSSSRYMHDMDRRSAIESSPAFHSRKHLAKFSNLHLLCCVSTVTDTLGYTSTKRRPLNMSERTTSPTIDDSENAADAAIVKEPPHSMDDDAERILLTIAADLPSLEQCYAFAARDPSCGAVATFCGITRNHFAGRRVTRLSYEAYVPMAEKELRALCRETMGRWDVRRVVAVHILGDCPVGRASVILACASPHRRDALAGCDYLIEQLKRRIPIWKQEVYQGDARVWKENAEWFDQDGIPQQLRRMVPSCEDDDKTEKSGVDVV